MVKTRRELAKSYAEKKKLANAVGNNNEENSGSLPGNIGTVDS